MKKLNYIRQNMKKEALDGVILTKIENIFYLTEFWGSFGFMVITKDKAFLLTDGRYLGKIADLGLDKSIEFLKFSASGIKDFSKKFEGKFGIESTTTLSQLSQFEKWFSDVEIVSLEGKLDDFRRIKTQGEIKKIQQAQSSVDENLIQFLKLNLREGVSEKALKFRLEEVLRREGKYGLSFEAIVAFGENSATAHHESGERKLQSGDNILIDCGVTSGRYCSDVTRNYVFEKGTKSYISDYSDLLKIQQKTLEKFKANAQVSDLDDFCKKLMGSKSKFYTHSLGHGVGIEIHESPGISSRSKDKLLLGEIVTCEPGWYFPRKYGIRIEDLLLVTKNRPKILSQITKDLLSFDEQGSVKKIVEA